MAIAERTEQTTQGELLAKADRFLAGGGLGLFTLPPDVNLVIREGHGSHVTSVAGKEYIDYHLGSGPALLGHGHPAVTEAVSAQLPKGTTFYFLNEHVLRLAERLVEAVPCAEQVQFTGSGTEATFFSLRVARSLTGRPKVMKLEGGWHGMHDYALWGTVPARPSDYPRAQPDSTGIPPSIGEDVLVAPFNETELVVSLIERHAHELAAVLVEPLQRVLKPEPGFLEALRDVTRRHGIVLVFDEIVTGFRIAWGGAQERYGVVPDLATYGKAMAGGFPMAALAGRAEVLAPLDARRTERTNLAWASGTLNGNPISAAAGNAALDVLSQPGVYERLQRTGARLRRGIEESGRRHGFPTQALGEDAVFGVRFMENEAPRTWMDLQAHDKALGLRWGVELLERGLLVNPNEKFYVSIVHSDEDVDRTLEICDAAFRAVKAAG
ncbi:MAG: Glutamate-1-semialdehyde aminotransferase [uncultured Chloroflexi bacterium]|uniref:Glutamate-1-semialdehyde aminotransferase n=1 Tax=uncultured Chloroflexota bacterium TaxID=166587 RepID=A0A6J4KFV2_9CHLR|nr:MAG: Glutamate-1-semialdehyde aminotransferase [uncultured Chloroflexota bacterium]